MSAPAARKFALLTSVTLATFSVAVPAVLGQDTMQPDVENSRMSVLAEVAASGVLVRSGPNENYYPTQRLSKGDQVTIVGIKGDWLKILPPAGSFSYVAKRYVDASGSVGTVKGSDVTVRAGSDLVPTKSTIQTKVQEGDKLTILGEQDEYYKVKPPEGAYLFISKALVTPVKTLGPTATVAPQPAPAGPGPRSMEISPGPSNTAPRSRASEQAPVAPAPATMSAEQMAAGTEYDKADADYTALADKPLAEQPLDDLIARYTALTQNPNLPVTLRRTAQARLANLKSRQEAQKDLLAVQKSQQESNERLAKLRAEQDALAAKMRGTQFYTAVGTLLPSEIQQDGVNLYRLADPATSRTVVYVKPDPSLASYANNFVGVKGEVQTDAALGIKVLTPTAVQQVDPANVNNSVTAMMLPPSMLPSVGSGATTQP